MSNDMRFRPLFTARLAGLLYLIVIVGGAIAELFTRERLVVGNDAAATAHNIVDHEQLFRWGFASDVIALLCVIPLIVLLYQLLTVVDRRIALIALCFSLVGTAVQAASLLGHFAVIVLLTRGPAFGVPMELLQAQAYMALQLQGIGYAIALAFFGGTMLMRGLLIMRSTFMPRVIGLFLTIEGIAYLANSFVNFVAPHVAPTIFAALLATGLAEVGLCLWLLAVGVNVPKWREQASVAASS